MVIWQNGHFRIYDDVCIYRAGIELALKRRFFSQFVVLILVAITTSCSKSKPAEQNLFGVLANKQEVFYFEDDFGKERGPGYSLEAILNVEVPSSEFVVTNKNNKVYYNDDMTVDVDENGMQYYSQNQPDLGLKQLAPLFQSDQGRFLMHKNNGFGDYFVVEMNYQTNRPIAINFVTGIGNNLTMKFVFNEATGQLDEYHYQETETVSSGFFDFNPQVSYKLVAEKLYVYNKSILKVECNLNQDDKDLILVQANILKDIVTKLWYLNKKCRTVNFAVSLNKAAITKSIDSLIFSYKNTGLIDRNNNALFRTFDANKIQIIYSISRDGINTYRNLKMYGLRNMRGEINDKRILGGIEEILKRNIDCNNPRYRCLKRTSKEEIGIVIENCTVTGFFVGN